MMKWNFRKGALVLMALLLCLAAVPSGLAEGEELTLRLDAEIRLAGPAPAAETYTVRMTADDERNPMPGGQAGGSYDLRVTGAGIEAFPAMAFDALGIYRYTIEQLPGTNALCQYDGRVYRLTVSVINAESGGLAMEVALRAEGLETKMERVVFENAYQAAPAPTPAPTTRPAAPAEDPTPPSGGITPTGVEDMWMLYLGGSLLLLVAAGFVIRALRREGK